jgi:hypothetical protein
MPRPSQARCSGDLRGRFRLLATRQQRPDPCRVRLASLTLRIGMHAEQSIHGRKTGHRPLTPTRSVSEARLMPRHAQAQCSGDLRGPFRSHSSLRANDSAPKSNSTADKSLPHVAGVKLIKIQRAMLSLGQLGERAYAINSRITFPCTSVSRKSRPA